MRPTYKVTSLAAVLDLDTGLPTLARNLERPVLHVALDLGVVGLAANKTLGVEDGVLRVGVERVLRTITNTRDAWVGTPLRKWNKGRTYSRSSSEKLTHEGVIR